MKTRKQVSFDLDIKALEEFYPDKNWRKAYDVIKRYMILNGFIWQQGSVYISKNKISYTKISNMLEDLIIKNQWLHKCMRDCVVSSITKQYSQNHLFNKDIDIPKHDRDIEINLEKGLKESLKS